MKFFYIPLLFALVGFSQAKSQDKPNVPVYSFAQLESMLYPSADNDTLYLFNFWATYCAPCIKELPEFDRIGEELSAQKVKVLLVSLDFKSQLESRVIPFIQKRGVKSKVVLLSDPDANAWIDKVSSEWSGALPATLAVKGAKREFYEKAFTYDELKQLTTKFLNK